ncbi:MAG TPA: sensor histidine kinase, partial [Verrucomicrobiae bacterium]|nr:sensor histidine kinase [Verrucomicrobiae bacterium]
EQSIKDNILVQQIQNQKDSTKSLAQHIQSDLNLIMSKLQGLAYSSYLQEKNIQSSDTNSFIQNYYLQINSSSPVDRLFVVDKKGIVKIDLFPKSQPSYVGMNFSYRDWVKKTKNTLQPQFSDGFMGKDGKYRIAITYPISIRNSSSETTNYAGLVCVVIPTSELFSYYGNIYNVQSKYLVVLDSKAIHLVHPLESLKGKPFYGNYSQNLIKNNSILNNLINTTVFSGKPSSALYDFVNGQRFTTGYPIILNGKPQYSVFIITPTLAIYSKIDSTIFNEILEMLFLISAIITAIMILILFLIRMNNILDRNIKRRTIELENSNNRLLLVNEKIEYSNKQLQAHDKMQKEFINIASHELRTPIQPILGLLKIVKDRTQDNEQKVFIDIVIKNANRLKQLTEDILDVTKIESNKFFLKKESVCIWELLHSIMKEFRHPLENDIKKIRFKLYFKNIDLNTTFIADKDRISQVISNLIDNSIKFISKENGKDRLDIISLIVEKTQLNSKNKKDGGGDDKIVNEIIISVKDDGKGIDSEIYPRLFTKFASKSFQGSGLGLYICKSIIEAHGGKIWAKNNEDGIGATFSFSLHLDN